MAGGKRLVPASFLGGELQHTAHAGRVPGGREVLQVLILRQQVQPILQRIFPGGDREFIDKAFQRERGLQRIHRAHPAERYGRFGHHIFDRIVRKAVDRTGFVGEIGIDSIRHRQAFLAAD